MQTLFNNDLLIDRGLGPLFEEPLEASRPGGRAVQHPRFLLARRGGAPVQPRPRQSLAPYNDYRELVKFPRVTAFDQINGDPEIQDALRRVYGTVDRIELYAGFFAEELRPHSALPPLVGRIVGIDAFSQAFTNPLLSENVFNEETFSPVGWSTIHETNRLEDILNRNLPPDSRRYRASMTQPGQAVGE